jgi:hypothetical protein
MNNKRELVPNLVLAVALVGVLIFAGRRLVQGGRTSAGGNIALGLAVVALAASSAPDCVRCCNQPPGTLRRQHGIDDGDLYQDPRD